MMVGMRVRALVSAAVVAAVLTGITARTLLAPPYQFPRVVTKANADRGSGVPCDPPDYVTPQEVRRFRPPDNLAGFISVAVASAPALSPQSHSWVRGPPAF